MRINLTFLKHIFAGFLRTRHFGRHFRRLTLLESVAGTDISRELPSALAQELIAAATSDATALLTRLESHADGITESDAKALRVRYGTNEIEHEKPQRWDPFPPEPCLDVDDGDDRHHHGYRYFPADGSNRLLLQAAGAASQFFPDPDRNIAGLCDADTTGEGILLPPLWLAVADVARQQTSPRIW